jgi:hypothetical protein
MVREGYGISFNQNRSKTSRLHGNIH